MALTPYAPPPAALAVARGAQGSGRTAMALVHAAVTARDGDALTRALHPAAAGLCCSYNVRGGCGHTRAVWRCAECAPSDAQQRAGLHCNACFAARHPWTRTTHRPTPIPPPPCPLRPPWRDPLPAPVRGLVDMLGGARQAAAALGPPLATQRAAVAHAAAKAEALLSRASTLLLELRDDDARARNAAARKIQGLQRRRALRRWVRTAMRLQWGRVLDAGTGRVYFVHRYSGASQWDAPALFGVPVDVGLFPRVLAGALSEDGAARIMQAAWRGAAARRTLCGLALSAYRRAVDPETQRQYYYNVLTGASRWDAPAFLRGVVLPAEDC